MKNRFNLLGTEEQDISMKLYALPTIRKVECFRKIEYNDNI